MISRRTALAGLATLTVPALGGCAGGQGPVSARMAGTGRMSAQGGLIAPSAAGLDAVIDISHLVAVSDFALVRRRGNILGVVHKASEGGDWFDPMYSVRRPQAEAVGLLWGAYHFGTRQYSGAEQAGAFLAAARPGPATLMALDLEPNERHPANTMTLDQAEEFVRTVYAATGRLPLVYTHPSWANGERYGRAGRRLGRPITPESVVSRCELWVADYRDAPELPWAWAGRGWRLWQYVGDDQGSGIGPFGASCQAVEGVDHCDRNLFAGGAAALRQFWMGRGGVV